MKKLTPAGRHENQQHRKAHRRNSTAESSTSTSTTEEKSSTLCGTCGLTMFDDIIVYFSSTQLAIVIQSELPLDQPLLGMVAIGTATCQTIYFE